MLGTLTAMLSIQRSNRKQVSPEQLIEKLHKGGKLTSMNDMTGMCRSQTESKLSSNPPRSANWQEAVETVLREGDVGS